MGGLPRRATVLESIAHEAPVVVDGGDSLTPRDVSADPGAARIKADTVADAWSAGGIDGVALSARDWTLGTDALRGIVEAHSLPVVAANLVCGDQRPFPGHRVVERRGKRIGIVGVTAGEVDGCTVEPAGPALRAAVAALGSVDLTVALVPVERREIAAMGDLPADLVVMTASTARLDLGGAAPLTPTARGKTLLVGRIALHPGTTQVWSSAQRQVLAEAVDRLVERVGRTEAEVAEASAADRPARERRLEHFRGQLAEARASLAAYGDGAGQDVLTVDDIELDDKIADNPAILEKVRATLARLDARTPVALPTGPRLVAEGPFAGSDACKDCHPAQTAQWTGTAHARAYTNLVADGHGADPACVECHVTGWSATGGISTVAEIGPLRDVQCEACHGPGRSHIAAGGQVDLIADSSAERCTQCHDGDRDGGRFDLGTYLPRVLHGPQAPAGP